MNPSDVRRQILAEHDRLRGRLQNLEDLATRAADGDGSAWAETRRGLGELLVSLRAHVESEEAILVPALEAADAWGPLRAKQVRDEHVTQLRLLATWERAAADDGLSPGELNARFRLLAGTLRADMEAEEADLLRPDVLRDDVVAIQQASS